MRETTSAEFARAAITASGRLGDRETSMGNAPRGAWERGESRAIGALKLGRPVHMFSLAQHIACAARHPSG